MSDAEQPQWPREIWCAPVGEYEFSGDYVLSEWATVPRWEGDTERDRDWHRFIDADIYASADKYWRARLEAQEALLREAMAALGKLHHAVCGETGFAQCVRDDSKTLYPWPALDVADHAARATLAKLREHLEDKA